MGAMGVSQLWLGLLGVVYAVLALGCSDSLPPASGIQSARPIGARVQVRGDERRAWPRIGEAFSVQWLVAFPADPAPLTWAFVACVPTPSSFGIPTCATAPFATSLQAEPSQESPFMDLVMPDEDVLRGATQVLLLGVLCTEGSPAIDLQNQRAQCAGGNGAQAANVNVFVPVLRSDAVNFNPQFYVDSITWQGSPWPPRDLEPPPTGCLSESPSPTLPVYSESEQASAPDVIIGVPSSERETYTIQNTSTGESMQVREEILISTFTTQGQMERKFSVIDRLNPADPAYVAVQWQPPSQAPSNEGQTVRFYFVMRDQRGGVGWTTRVACWAP
jgi:hypothetical protein